MRRGAPALLLLAAVFVSHLPLLSAGYVQDDHLAVEANPVVDAASIVSASYWEGVRGGDRSLYRPLTVATYAAERALAGHSVPWLSHAVNLLLHAAVCWRLYALAVASGIAPEAALAASLVFAVTPSKSEAVANVVGRAEILAALFTLAAMRLVLVRGSRWSAWGAGACVLLAGASKETGLVALPLAALAIVLVRDDPAHRETPRDRAIDAAGRILPSVLGCLVLLVARTRALEALFPPQTVPIIDNPIVAEHGARAYATALGLLTRYARIVLLPIGLSNDYSGGSIPIEPGFAAVRPIVGLLLGAGAIVLARRGGAVALGVALAVLPYLLIGNLLVPVGAILAERFLYLPVAGLCFLLAILVERFGRPARTAAWGAAAVLAALMFARAIDWKSDATIFAATAAHNPASPRALYWLGTIAKDEGRADDALGRFDASIRAWPSYASPWHDKGLVLASRGDSAGAEAALREAVRLEPALALPRLNLALVLHRRGDRDGALRLVRQAVLLDPDDAKAWAELGHLRFETGSFRDAAIAYRRALALGRSDLAPRLAAAEAQAGGSGP